MGKLEPEGQATAPPSSCRFFKSRWGLEGMCGTLYSSSACAWLSHRSNSCLPGLQVAPPTVLLPLVPQRWRVLSVSALCSSCILHGTLLLASLAHTAGQTLPLVR